MRRSGLFMALLLVLAIQPIAGQVSFPTLEVQQFPRSTVLWLSPKDGQVVTESGFFEQPGIADFLRTDDVMELREIRHGAGGITHRHYWQRHGGYEVEGAMVITHERDGLLRMANGQLAMLPPAQEPAVMEGEAVYAVLSHLGVLGPIASEGTDYLTPSVSLLYAPNTWETYGAPLEHRLAYRVTVILTNPYSSTVTYVDAGTGEIFRVDDGAMHCAGGSALTLYHGWQPINGKFFNFLGSHYKLRDDCRGEMIHTKVDEHDNNDTLHFYDHAACSDLKDGDNLWQAAEQRPAATLHWASEMTYDFMLDKLGRDGVDGAGGEIHLVYHPFELRERTGVRTIWGWQGRVITPFNAVWDAKLAEAHFGRGDGVAPWVSLDVVSHELTHGIISTGNEQRLRGGTEARTLNESFADIFSVCAEAYILPLHDPGRTANFTFGEDVATGPLRSLSEPWLFNCPRAYNAAAWQVGNTNEPHQFSSVQSYWFFLLAFGSSGKPVEGNVTVCGIGLDNALQIAYRTITDYMQSGATHQDAQTASIQAARDTFGVGSFEVAQCENAWAAVGLGTGSNFCNPVGFHETAITMQSSIAVAPNPATTSLEVVIHTFRKEGECTLRLWSSMGTLVVELPVEKSLAPGSTTVHLDCRDLPAGAYHLQFSSNHSHLWKKVVITR